MLPILTVSFLLLFVLCPTLCYNFSEIRSICSVLSPLFGSVIHGWVSTLGSCCVLITLSVLQPLNNIHLQACTKVCTWLRLLSVGHCAVQDPDSRILSFLRPAGREFFSFTLSSYTTHHLSSQMLCKSKAAL